MARKTNWIVILALTFVAGAGCLCAEEYVEELEARYTAAIRRFEPEFRDFTTHTATVQSITPEEGMAAIEGWLVARADVIESLNHLADHLDEHAPLPPKPSRPEHPLLDENDAHLANELLRLARRFDLGEISLDAFDNARIAAIARHTIPEVVDKPIPTRAIPVVRETGDPSRDYIANARRLAALSPDEAASQIDDPTSAYSRSLRRLQVTLDQ